MFDLIDDSRQDTFKDVLCSLFHFIITIPVFGLSIWKMIVFGIPLPVALFFAGVAWFIIYCLCLAAIDRIKDIFRGKHD